jgi:hypothetical protein
MIASRRFYRDIESILKKGLQIGDQSSKKIKLTAKKISLILNSGHSPFIGYVHDEGRTIHIETSYFDPVLSVEVSDKGIFFIPLVDSGWHGAFFEILKIIYLYEQQVIGKEVKEEKESLDEFDWI